MNKQFKNREIKKQALYDYLISDSIARKVERE